MSIRFSEMPGARERHLRRKYNNPLFPGEANALTQAMVQEAQREDVDALHAFLNEFRSLVQACIDLKANEESEVILGLKARLDRAYVVSAGLYGDQTEVQEALKRLIVLIMDAIKRGAEDDPVAKRELLQEEMARQTNYQLLGFKLVADLMNPESPIGEGELAAILLSESEKAVDAALWLFETEQLAAIIQNAEALLDEMRRKGSVPEQALARLAQLKAAREAGEPGNCSEPLRA